jgi:hypothetical protein
LDDAVATFPIEVRDDGVYVELPLPSDQARTVSTSGQATPPILYADTEVVEFSPTHELQETMAVVEQDMATAGFCNFVMAGDAAPTAASPRDASWRCSSNPTNRRSNTRIVRSLRSSRRR